MNLVTGATGHIGNVLVRALLERGERVRALVRPGKIPVALTGLDVEIVPGDVLEKGSLLSAMQGVEIVYHLAARISVDPIPDPETERVNLEGTRNVLDAIRQAGVRRLVYASSIYAMRIPGSGIVDESLPFDPNAARGIYDRSKAEASLEVLKAVEQGLDAVILCPTAVAGPYDFQLSEAGRGILYNLPPGIKFIVDGAYDFVDVRDVAQGFLLAVRHGKSGQVYILGGDRLTVNDVSQAVCDTAGGWHMLVRIPDWLADVAGEILPFLSGITGGKPLCTPYSLGAIRSNSYISHPRATRELGYQPRPALRAIVDAVRWFQTWQPEEAQDPNWVEAPTG